VRGDSVRRKRKLVSGLHSTNKQMKIETERVFRVRAVVRGVGTGAHFARKQW